MGGITVISVIIGLTRWLPVAVAAVVVGARPNLVRSPSIVAASCGAAKVCCSVADARTGSVSARRTKPGPDASDDIRRNHVCKIIFIGNK